MDCDVLQETKLTNRVYNFQVMAIEAPSAHRGGVAIFYHKAEQFSIEKLHLHGPNVIKFQLVTGRQRWHVVGCYTAPRYASTVEDVAAAIRY